MVACATSTLSANSTVLARLSQVLQLVRDRTSSLTLTPSRPALPCPHHQRLFFHTYTAKASSSMCSDEGQGQLNTVLGNYHCLRQQPRLGTFSCPLVVTWALDLNTSRGCDRTTNLGMASGVMRLKSPWPQVAAQSTQISMLPMAAWPSDIHMVLGGTPKPRHPHGLWC